jgi:hypothetical protein
MAVEWQSRDFLTDWTGLFNRRQSIDVPPSYARVARNVDFFGSAIGKRQGNQLVNGWSTVATGAWTSAGGPVADPSGFRTGGVETLTFAAAPAVVTGTAVLQAVVGNQLQCTGLTGTLPTAGTVIYVVRPLGAVIQGLYHAVFRDPTGNPTDPIQELLLAAAGSAIWDVWGTEIGVSGSYVPATLGAPHWPQTLVTSTWGSTTSGPINSVDTLVATDHSTAYESAPNSSAASPDIIQIVHAGTVIYEGTIASFSGTTIHLTGAASQPPQIFDAVFFFPHRTAADTRFTMLNNRVYVTSAAAAYPVQSGPGAQPNQRQPPTVIEMAGGVAYERRMGVRAPTQFPNPEPLETAGGLWGNYWWRYTYVNLANGQESEASPFSETVGGVNVGGIDGVTGDPIFQSASVQVWKSPDPQVGGINIYRSLSNQNGAWYLVNQTPLPNISQTYHDVAADSDLTLLLKTFTNECPPDTVTLLAVWVQAGALIGIDNGTIAEGGETVCWSDAPDIVNGVYKIESWPVNNTLFVNRDDGDKLTSLGVFYDSVAVWKGRSMHRIVGAPPDIILQPISFRDDHTGVGIWSAKGFVMDTDVAIFVSDDGFYQVSRYEGVQQGFTSSRISRQIDQEFLFRTAVGASAQYANRALAHLLYHRARRRLQAFLPVDGNARPTDTFVYQMEGTVDGTPHGWSLWSIPPSTDSQSFVSASCMVNFRMDVDHPHYGCGSTGLVVIGDEGAGDWQSFPVTIDYETVWFSPGGAGTVCRARAVDCVFVPQAGMPAVQLNVGRDFNLPPDEYLLPAIVVLGIAGNTNPLILGLAQYYSLGLTETSVTGLFLIEDFTFWFQRLPVGVTPRIIPIPLSAGLP